MPTERSAGAVVFRKDKGNIYYLILHYEAGHWDFVKGNIEKREGIKQTIIREAVEEAGIKELKFLSGFKETIKYFYKLKTPLNLTSIDNGGKVTKIYLTFSLYFDEILNNNDLLVGQTINGSFDEIAIWNKTLLSDELKLYY